MERARHHGAPDDKNQPTMMIHNKRFVYPTLIAALVCGALLVHLRAQDAPDHPRPPHGPPPSPLFDALDTNHDGVISAEEIANAPAALKALLKNGATQITRDDVRPPRPPKRDEQARGGGGPPADDQARPADAAREDHGRPPRPEDAGEGDRPHPPGDDARKPDDNGPQARPHASDRPEGRHHGPPPSVLFDALDTNHDGVISADEIANAPAALKKLDKNGTGQIKPEDLRPPQRPPEDE